MLTLDSRLEQDCHVLGQIQSHKLLLHKNANYPWLILVPETQVEDFLDLPAQDQLQLLQLCAALSSFIKSQIGCAKVNFGAIGNVVRQMHLHVVGRKESDGCWPAVVWGNAKDGSNYSQEQITKMTETLKTYVELT